MSWQDVGSWIKDNAGAGAALVGSLLTGNVPGAVAAGVSIVSGATGTNDPAEALIALQQDPAACVRLKEIAAQDAHSIRQHIEQMERLRLEDDQARHAETQETIREGDKSDDWFTRRTRPAMAWVCLIAALAYVYTGGEDVTVLGVLLALPWAYCGLRMFDKNIPIIWGKTDERS